MCPPHTGQGAATGSFEASVTTKHNAAGAVRYASAVEELHRESADRTRSLIQAGRCAPAQFRAALTRVPPRARDGWVDWVFGLDSLPEDGPDLPSGCVAYLPSAVDALLRVTEYMPVRHSDVFVDVGAGAGRAAALVHLLTGAPALGIEVQGELTAAARKLAARLNLSRVSFVEGDGAQITGVLTAGTVFFLYCPFSGERLTRMLASLEPVARRQRIGVCCIDLPLPRCPWLTLTAPIWADLEIYRSTLHDSDSDRA